MSDQARDAAAQQAEHFFRSKFGGLPACGNCKKAMQFQDLAMIHSFDSGQRQGFGIQYSGTGAVVVCCNNCGHMMFFNTGVLGIDQPGG